MLMLTSLAILDPMFLAGKAASGWATKRDKQLFLLVPVERIELPTFGLQNRCSTAELNRRCRDQWAVEIQPLVR